MQHARLLSMLGMLAIASACAVGGEQIVIPPLEAGVIDEDSPFYCDDESNVRCELNVHLSCAPIEEFLERVEVDCTPMNMVCSPERTCITCTPGMARCKPCEPDDNDCDPNQIEMCDDEGAAWHDTELCDLTAGEACYDGMCEDMCERAKIDRSYVGCEFFAVDLDNAAIDDVNNAAAQQFAVVVANPQEVPVEVTVEINDAPFGESIEPRELASVTVPPGSLEIFELPQREVDGSTPGELNDGTHTAISSNAFRVESSHPIIAYQFNPLENVNVFSNDASLLLPTSAIDTDYTVVGWPQTIGDSDDPEMDFDSTSSNEDLRAFLTIVGTEEDTEIDVTLGASIVRIAEGDGIASLTSGDHIRRTIGPYDVINLETEGFNADFTGTLVNATKPVTVFVGSEASDVPKFGTYATRRCCADHLEEQLLPDSVLGSYFSIARMPPRTAALVAAAREDDSINVAIADEPEWVRVVAVASGQTTLITDLAAPQDLVMLQQGEDVMLKADQDFTLQSDQRVTVLQALPSQGVTGIPPQYPGGDPDIITVPPVQQYRKDYIFLTPDKYAFDFVVITAEARARILLDGEDIADRCTTSPADGRERSEDDPPPDRVVHRCQLSFPIVTSGAASEVLPGEQDDGVHTILSDLEVGIVVYGFDRFVSYAYVGGLDLDVLQ